MLDGYRKHLDGLAERSRLRRLSPRQGLDFASNDYLALAADPALRRVVTEAIERGVPPGSGGSRLLRGNHPEHEALEQEAAAFFGAESALYFSSGYAANSALFSTLPQRGDLILHDALIHASVHEGMRLGRAETRNFPHNQADALEAAIRDWRASGATGRIWIAVESLYSMDGDRAPLAEIAAVAARHDAFLVADEAHATGIFGENGRGLAADLQGSENLVTLHTCGKALGCEGALLCLPDIFKQFLINRGRAFIFSTAPSPLMAAAVRGALRLIAGEPERRARLLGLADHAARRLADDLDIPPSGSQIIPIILGDDKRTMDMAGRLQEAGFDIRGIRPPTVPIGTSRLRISITLNTGQTEVDAMIDTLVALSDSSR